MRITFALFTLLFALLGAGASHAENRPVIVELYTSHGCSSCPAADRIIKEFYEADPSIFPLSFHVDYWDHLGWKDPFASEASTKRQRNYAQLQGRRNVFTPQVIVDGLYSAIGNDHEDVNKAIRQAKNVLTSVPIRIAPDKYDLIVEVSETPESPFSTPAGAVVWLVFFVKDSITAVDAGENSGMTMENVNSVIGIKRLGYWHNSTARYHINKNEVYGDGLAIILQSSPQNQILGAATYYDYKS